MPLTDDAGSNYNTTPKSLAWLSQNSTARHILISATLLYLCLYLFYENVYLQKKNNAKREWKKKNKRKITEQSSIQQLKYILTKITLFNRKSLKFAWGNLSISLQVNKYDS